MNKISSRSVLVTLCSLILVSFLAACGSAGDDGTSMPSATASCQMKLYGVAIWAETRPPSDLERKTLRFGFEDSFMSVGGSYDKINNQLLFLPQFEIRDQGPGWVLVEVLKPPFYPQPPYAPARMRIRADAFEGYRYGRIWSCMVEELVAGDLVFIKSAGDETVPTNVAIDAYWPVQSWGNPITIPSGYESFDIQYFSFEGDSVSVPL